MGSEQKIGLIETNLDTHETVISGKTRSLMELGAGAGGPHYRGHHPGQVVGHQLSVHDPSGAGQRRTIGGVGGQMNGQGGGPGGPGEQRTNGGPGRPHKSMEFLLDKENQRNVLPPENELQKSHETGTNLNSNQTSPSVSTRGSFTRGGLNASVISGYSTASTTTGAGVNSTAGGGPSTIRNSFRQPYLGWRSQEKLSQPRTPAERLASSLLQQQGNSNKQKEQHQQLKEQQKANRQHQQQQKEESVVTPEIQSSIIEVTSAIVHYVNDQTNRHSRSRSTSPSQRCWLESSFVGTRPLDSPQTPMIENSSVLGSSHPKQQHQQHQQQHQQQTAGDHYRFNAGMNGVVCCEFDDIY